MMNNRKYWSSFLKVLSFILFGFSSIEISAQETSKLYQEFNLEIQGEYRYFFEDGLYENQASHYPSIALKPEYFLEWANGNQSLKIEGFLRLDRDERRSHADLREFYWQRVKNNWELSVGLKKIFWGVTESAHLVDVINQTDQVESFDGEAKLGQPVIHFSLFTGLGTFDFFAMPYFRKRQFAGEEGRLRTPFLLSKNDFTFENSLKEWHPDFAVRWSNSISMFDLGLSHFYGTGREPVFIPVGDGQGFEFVYPINHQTGIEAQATTGPMLWKVEGFSRFNAYQNVYALAAGMEYTFGNVKNSGIDIGIIGEYLYDSRDEQALSSLDNDLFIGSRIAFNDTQSTELLFGGIFDLNKSSKLLSLEASRRFGNSWKASLELRMLKDIDDAEFLNFFRQDSFAKLEVSKFF